MASEVDICNMALSHLGDAATLASISPPDGSAQSFHAALWYPQARDALLEMHDWGFASKRVTLPLLASAASAWECCYALPPDLINAVAVLAPDAADDVGEGQPYQLETLADGTDVIYTNQADAVLRYTARITDSTRFSPLFTTALSWSLASMLAGPVIKGDAGAAAAVRCEVMAFGRDGKSGWFGKAAAGDAGQRRSTFRDRHQAAWIAAR